MSKQKTISTGNRSGNWLRTASTSDHTPSVIRQTSRYSPMRRGGLRSSPAKTSSKERLELAYEASATQEEDLTMELKRLLGRRVTIRAGRRKFYGRVSRINTKSRRLSIGISGKSTGPLISSIWLFVILIALWLMAVIFIYGDTPGRLNGIMNG